MKRIIAIILLTISFVSCNGQDYEMDQLKNKAISLQGDVDSLIIQIDTIKFLYNYKISQYDDTIKQMTGQIEAYKVMIAECPDTNLIRTLEYQLHALEIQIANMKIEQSKSYNLMLRFNELWKEWSELYPIGIKE